MFLRGLEAIALPLAMFGSWLLWGSTTGPWGAGTRKSAGAELAHRRPTIWRWSSITTPARCAGAC